MKLATTLTQVENRKSLFSTFCAFRQNKRIKDFSKQFADDIYNVGMKLLTKLNDDIDNNRILNKHEICALENIIKIINKEEKGQTKNLDNFSFKKKSAKFLTPDVIEEINSKILGWNGAY